MRKQDKKIKELLKKIDIVDDEAIEVPDMSFRLNEVCKTYPLKQKPKLPTQKQKSLAFLMSSCAVVLVFVFMGAWALGRFAYSEHGDMEGKAMSMQEFSTMYDVVILAEWEKLNLTVYSENDVNTYARLIVADGDDILYVYFLLQEDFEFSGFQNYLELLETATKGEVEYKYLIDNTSSYSLATFTIGQIKYCLNLDSQKPQRILDIIEDLIQG